MQSDYVAFGVPDERDEAGGADIGGLDKVRGALSASAQWELATLIEGLTFTGVPAIPVPRSVRAALEHAWFEQRPLRIRYAGAHGTTTIRTIRVERVIFERSLTLLNCVDLGKREPRQFRLDRIEWAEPVAITSASA